MVFFCICSTIFFVALCKIFVVRFDISPFTFSSHLCSFLWLISTTKFHSSPTELDLFISNLTEISNGTNTTSFWPSTIGFIDGIFSSISQVYLINNVLTGLIILLGVSICSLRLTILALIGTIVGQITSIYLFQVSLDEIRQGLWGLNSALTFQILGGMFFVLHGPHIWLYMIFGSVMTVFVQVGLIKYFPVFGKLPLMLPSIIICWFLCLLGGSSKYLIGIRLRSMSIPEDHLRRFRLSNLVKMHFQFLDDLSIILQKVGGNQNIPDEDLSTIENEFVPILLCSYTHQNDWFNLKSLLNEGADVNATDYDFRSSLHLAACDGNIKICRMLIEKFHADTNLIDDFGGTPLYDAFCHGHFHLIPYLYIKGARMPISKMKELIFFLCAFSFEGNLEAVQYLIACGVNPNLFDHNGRTALHLAVCGHHYLIVKYLVEEGNASTSIVDHYGHTPLDDAVRLSDNQITFYLQHWRADLVKNTTNIFLEDDELDDINIEDDFGEKKEVIERKSRKITEASLLPALFCTAAGEGNVKQMINILKQFPQFRADSVDYDFRSAAHIAAAEGQLSSIQFLCKHSLVKKQDLHWINQEDRWGFTPIEEAYRYGHNQVAEYLKEYQSKESKLPLSTTTTGISSDLSSKSTKTFIDSVKKWKKIFRFATLVLNNEAELIKSLLMSGVLSASNTYADYDGRTPMHWAALNGYINVVKVLQHCGDNGRTHKDRWGNSALDEAKRRKFMQIVHILLDDIV
ncbi:unnamed protein product [Adineta ricciae]|uniref:Uncharacterized protein n=2 Tax=Adineta ricciae TaxID=249248 RepID=A0A815N8B4_ADIRI|nr:unnamed protein product [Adineta ricciae]